MHIGKQIKEKRLELNMTQNELAEALNVSRSTVSNWEIERNYPDIQLIVSLSKILNIPLELLLQEESDVVKKITSDTKEKKHIKLKIKILYIILFALIIVGAIYVYQSNNYLEISNANKIISLKEHNSTIEIVTKLPIYRSLTGYYLDVSPQNKDTLQITLITKLDLTMSNKESISIPLDQDEFDKIDHINFISKNKSFKSMDLN